MTLCFSIKIKLIGIKKDIRLFILKLKKFFQMSFLLNKEKQRSTIIIIFVILSTLILLVSSFIKFFVVMLPIYLAVYIINFGVSVIYRNLYKNTIKNSIKILKIISSIILLLLGFFILYLFLSLNNFSTKIIIFLLYLPLLIIGLCGIIKSLVITVYSKKFRRLNMIIGMTSVFCSVIAFLNAEIIFLFLIIAFISLLLLNAIVRLALYLSEFELSLKYFKNVKIALFIMSTPPLKTNLLKQKISAINT